MSKRTIDEKIEHFKKKLRKYEKKKSKGVVVESPDFHHEDEDIVISEPDLNQNMEQEFIPEPDPQENELPLVEKTPPNSNNDEEFLEDHVVTTETQNPTTVATEPTENILDPELLAALGESTSEAPEFGEAIHENLASLWLPLLKKGMTKDAKDKITKDYLVPENCKLLQAPKLNAEISAAVSEIVRNRDKKLMSFQQQLGLGITAVNRAMTVLLSSDNKVSALKHLSDSCRILSDLHSIWTKDRIKLVTPSLEKNFLHVIQDAERDDTLFGASLSDKIKASKVIEKQGLQIKKPATANNKPAQPQQSGGRLGAQGNWTGPPRYQSNRGGRGRGAKPAQAGRRPYVATQAKPPTSSKPRATATSSTHH